MLKTERIRKSPNPLGLTLALLGTTLVLNRSLRGGRLRLRSSSSSLATTLNGRLSRGLNLLSLTSLLGAAARRSLLLNRNGGRRLLIRRLSRSIRILLGLGASEILLKLASGGILVLVLGFGFLVVVRSGLGLRAGLVGGDVFLVLVVVLGVQALPVLWIVSGCVFFFLGSCLRCDANWES